MAESDEDKVLLEDDSMDEMHELDDELIASVDTNASPAKPSSVAHTRRRLDRVNDDDDDDDDGKLSDSDKSEFFNGSSSDESESYPTQRMTRAPDRVAAREIRRGDNADEDEDEDQPPEIPGSPLRIHDESPRHMGERITYGGASTKQKQPAPSVDILTIDRDGEEDEYETKEAEAPRAMEFHTSSSSSDSEGDGSGSDEDDNSHSGPMTASKVKQHVFHNRPKTAAKELEQYRDVVPTEYYHQIVQDAPSSPKKQSQDRAITTKRGRQDQATMEIQSSITTDGNQKPRTKYKVRVPKEIEDMFQYVDVFNPEISDIPTRLQPFIPEYVPAIGLPFDGIQIPRPDGKADLAGVAFVREPRAQSNSAELELLLAAQAKARRRKRQMSTVERVHSIEDASNRPREIDQWIASVGKVQSSKPPRQVLYKKPMPSETSLMELWPEEFEEFLSSQPLVQISEMDLDLVDAIRVVCGVLDIPVYEGLFIHSLHALFSLYHEVVMYEKEMLGKPPSGGR